MCVYEVSIGKQTLLYVFNLFVYIVHASALLCARQSTCISIVVYVNDSKPKGLLTQCSHNDIAPVFICQDVSLQSNPSHAKTAFLPRLHTYVARLALAGPSQAPAL